MDLKKREMQKRGVVCGGELWVTPAARGHYDWKSGHLFFPPPFSFCHLIGADALWRAFELTSKEKKEILWVPVFGCLLHSSYTQHTHARDLHSLTLLTAISLRHTQTHGRVGSSATTHNMDHAALTETVDWTINPSVDFGEAFWGIFDVWFYTAITQPC